MRQKFREFYKYSDEEIEDFWENAIFSFDANILLNLYRYTENTRNEFLETLEYLAGHDRLWISYQAAFEYQKNRLAVISGTKKAYNDLIDELAKKNKDVDEVLNKFKKNQNLNIDGIKETFTKTFEEIEKYLNELDEKHPDLMDDDPIFDKLTELLDGRIGETMDKTEYNLIFKEGKERYEKKIPPGYMDLNDKKNESEHSLYGDLIIWKELIKKIKETPSKLIFITDDLKEDWWYIFNGKTIDSRKELAKEFYAETKNEIIIYKPEQFLKFYKEKIRNELKEETIKEVEETRKNDEILYTSITIPANLGYLNEYIGNHNLYDFIRSRDNESLDLLSRFQTSGTTGVTGYFPIDYLKHPDWARRHEASTIPLGLGVENLSVPGIETKGIRVPALDGNKVTVPALDPKQESDVQSNINTNTE